MKRILSGGLVFLCFFWCVDLVFGSAINSLTIGKRQAVSSPANVVYRGTLTGLRISSVDGTAFIDNAGATVPTYADGNHQISIFDSSGRELRGVLKAAGTSEGLGSELVTNGTFDSDISGWSNAVSYPFDTMQHVSGALNLISDGVSQTSHCYAFQTSSMGAISAGTLYKASFERTGTGPMPSVVISNTVLGSNYAIFSVGTSYSTSVLSNANSYFYIYTSSTNTSNSSFDNISLKIVTAPSSSGATIVSAKQGSTFNWTSKETGFAYNQASYTYEIWTVD